jgi:hypothetical protein
MRIRHSRLRLLFISGLIRPIQHPKLSITASLPGLAATPSSIPSSTPFSTTATSSMARYTSDPWNKLHDGMELYHNHFRHTFNEIYKRCEYATSDPEDSEELDELLMIAFGLYRHLDGHHSIEEYSLLNQVNEERIYSLFSRRRCRSFRRMGNI